MRKNYFYLFLSLLFIVSVANAQQASRQSHRKSIFHSRSTTNDIASRQEVNNGSGMKRSKPFETALADSSIWRDGERLVEKTIYSYDSQNRLVSDYYYRDMIFDEQTGEFFDTWSSIVNFRDVEEYDSEGRIVSYEEYSRDSDVTELKLRRKGSTTFYAGDKVKSQVDYEYYYNDNWDAVKTDYQYNVEGYITGADIYAMDEEDSDWTLIEEMKTEYTVGSDGKVAYILKYRDVDEGETEFWIEGKGIIGYDNQNRLIYSEWQDWDEDEEMFIPETRETIEYNSAGKKILVESEYYYLTDGKWSFAEREKYYYNDKNNITAFEVYNMDGMSGRIDYYYGGVAAIKDASASNQRIYIAKGKLTVISPVAETIQLFSIVGNSVESFSKVEGESTFDVSHLSGGVYLLKGNTGWTRKIVVNP